MKHPLGKHPNNLMPLKNIPRYGIGAKNGTTPIPGELFCREFFKMYYEMTGRSAKLESWNTRFVGILLGQTPAIGGGGRCDRGGC